MDEIKKIYEHSDDLHVRLYLLYEGSDENLYYDPELTKQAEAADVMNLFMKGLGVVDQNGVVHKDLSCSADGIVSYESGGGSGGSGTIIIEGQMTEDESGDYVFTPTTEFNKTASEALADVKNGVDYIIIVEVTGDVTGYILYRISNITPSINYIMFNAVGDNSLGTIYVVNGQWSVMTDEVSE